LAEFNDTFEQSEENLGNLSIKCDEMVGEDGFNSFKPEGKPGIGAKCKLPETLAEGVGVAS
jgi:hypothetical protein